MTPVRQARLYERADGKVRCGVCERRCLLVDGGTGWCRTRIHREGVLYTLIYGAVSSLSTNPIEKKPFYHFYPGSRALTAGSWSCNFGCPWCQNWTISKEAPSEGTLMTPEEFVRETMRRGCRGTSMSFNEPTLSLEWSVDVFQLARSRGLYNTYVTNGYMTAEALDLLAAAGLDAMNVDIKGDAASVRKYGKGIDAERIWHRCRQARGLGLHLEITLLVIPGVNDHDTCLREIAHRIAADLGPETPWHLSAYFPSYRFRAPPTPTATLERARDIGLGAGLEYVYLGNTPGHAYDNTYCPRCGTVLIERFGFDLVQYNVVDGRCPECGRSIAGAGWDWARH